MTSKGQPPFMTFKDLGQGTRSVHLDWFGNDTPLGLADGFKEAAEKVVAGAVADPRHPDKSFWPAAYLYRHALELVLKELVSRGAALLGISLSARELHGHRLRDLWTRARVILIEVWPEGDTAELQTADDAIADFDRVDPTGQAFRYRSDKNGRLFLEELPRVLSLEHMAAHAAEAFDLLSGAAWALGDMLDAQGDALDDR
jgi:hypothetical protein